MTNQNNSTQFRQWIIAAATRYHIPVDLALAIAQRESGIQQYDAQGNVKRGAAGEYGIMQVMRGTAPIEQVIDPRENIIAGVTYMAEMYRRFPDWSVAAAAYNAGPARVAAWMAGRKPLPQSSVEYARAVTRAAGLPDIGASYAAGMWPGGAAPGAGGAEKPEMARSPARQPAGPPAATGALSQRQMLALGILALTAFALWTS